MKKRNFQRKHSELINLRKQNKYLRNALKRKDDRIMYLLTKLKQLRQTYDISDPGDIFSTHKLEEWALNNRFVHIDEGGYYE